MSGNLTRREAMKIAGAGSLGALTMLAFRTALAGEREWTKANQRSPKDFGKGVWAHLKRNYAESPEITRRRLGALADAGVSLMCICVDRGGKGLFARSDETRVAANYPTWDPLKVLIAEAGKVGIRVHIWLCVFKSRCNAALFKRHPDAVAVFPTGWKKGRQNQGKWSCACQPRVQKYMLDVYRSLADRYTPAGLHLDYVRTGVQCQCTYCAAAMARQGIDIRAVQKPYDADFARWLRTGARGIQRKYAAMGLVTLKDDGKLKDERLDRWIAWRVDRLTQFVTRVAAMARRRKMEVSAAVKHYWPRQIPTGAQDWVRWAREGLVDYLFPMIYTTKTDRLKKAMEHNLGLLRSTRVAYWPGLWKEAGASEQLAQQLGGQIRIARSHGVPGVMVFPEFRIGNEDLKMLKSV